MDGWMDGSLSTNKNVHIRDHILTLVSHFIQLLINSLLNFRNSCPDEIAPTRCSRHHTEASPAPPARAVGSFSDRSSVGEVYCALPNSDLLLPQRVRCPRPRVIRADDGRIRGMDHEQHEAMLDGQGQGGLQAMVSCRGISHRRQSQGTQLLSELQGQVTAGNNSTAVGRCVSLCV